MRCVWLKRLMLPLFFGALHCVVSAAEMLPVHLSGTWATAESLYEGTDKQTEVYLLMDGFGIAVGSTQAAQRIDGTSDGKPGLRAIIGFPVQATLSGDILRVRLLFPAKKSVENVRGLELSCRYDSTGPTLTCIGPDGVPIVLKRRSDVVSAAMTQKINDLRIALP